MKNRNAYKHKICIECGEPMTGICSYKARVICEPCGGYSLLSCPEDKTFNTTTMQHMTKVDGGING